MLLESAWPNREPCMPLLTASQAGAGDGGHPEVGGAGVEDHSEALWRGANGDGPVVLHLQGQELLLKCETNPGFSPGFQPSQSPSSRGRSASGRAAGDTFQCPGSVHGHQCWQEWAKGVTAGGSKQILTSREFSRGSVAASVSLGKACRNLVPMS